MLLVILKDPVLSITRLCYFVCWHGNEASSVFGVASIQLRGKKLLRLVLLVSLNLLY